MLQVGYRFIEVEIEPPYMARRSRHGAEKLTIIC